MEYQTQKRQDMSVVPEGCFKRVRVRSYPHNRGHQVITLKTPPMRSNKASIFFWAGLKVSFPAFTSSMQKTGIFWPTMSAVTVTVSQPHRSGHPSGAMKTGCGFFKIKRSPVCLTSLPCQARPAGILNSRLFGGRLDSTLFSIFLACFPMRTNLTQEA